MIVKAGVYDRVWQGKFSEKEQIFLMEFAQTSDAPESARKAGFSETVVSWWGKKFLEKQEARAELLAIKSELDLEVGSIRVDDLVEEFMIIAQASIVDFYDELTGEPKDVLAMDPVKAKAIKEIKRTVNPKNGHVTTVITMHDKLSALQNLGRIGGHYAADNGQGSSGDVNVQIVLPGGMSNL